MLRAWYLPSYVRSLNRANRIIVDSEATAARCRAVGMDGSKLSVIYECFDQERYKAATSASSREHFRSEYGIPNNVIAIGLVGQILKHKGQEEFIHAAKTVASEYPNVHFFVVGDDSMSSDKEFLPFLSRLVTELGLEKKITFTGFLSDIPQVMAGLDIVAVPSREEAFGRVIVEAIASGRPVVASNTGGILEIVQEGVTGQLFPVKDHEALAECLLRLCRDEDLRTAMGRRGPASVARFDVRSHVQQFAALYRGLVPGDFSL